MASHSVAKFSWWLLLAIDSVWKMHHNRWDIFDNIIETSNAELFEPWYTNVANLAGFEKFFISLKNLPHKLHRECVKWHKKQAACTVGYSGKWLT